MSGSPVESRRFVFGIYLAGSLTFMLAMSLRAESAPRPEGGARS